MSKDGRMSQLVKCKNIRLYLQLYIPIDNEVKIQTTYVNNITKHKTKVRKQCLLHKTLTEMTLAQPIIAS